MDVVVALKITILLTVVENEKRNVINPTDRIHSHSFSYYQKQK